MCCRRSSISRSTWRWKLKSRTERLRQVHGDFHPWNILFREGADFTALDRSRGEWGEAADDVTCLTLNYLFFSLQRSGRLEGAFETLWRRFWDRYLERSGDREILQVAAPFLAFRGIVMANPVWYPALDERLRHRMLDFVLNVLAAERFEPDARQRVLRPVSFAVWLTGLSGSGKSAVARELLDMLHARGAATAVLESDVMRTQLTPFPRYDDAERDFFYRALADFCRLPLEGRGGHCGCHRQPPRVPRPGTRGDRALRRDLREHAARGLRGARYQGTLQLEERDNAAGRAGPLRNAARA